MDDLKSIASTLRLIAVLRGHLANLPPVFHSTASELNRIHFLDHRGMLNAVCEAAIPAIAELEAMVLGPKAQSLALSPFERQAMDLRRSLSRLREAITVADEVESELRDLSREFSMLSNAVQGLDSTARGIAEGLQHIRTQLAKESESGSESWPPQGIAVPPHIQVRLRQGAQIVLDAMAGIPQAYDVTGATGTALNWLEQIANEDLPAVALEVARGTLLSKASTADVGPQEGAAEKPEPLPRWVDRSNYVGRTYHALEHCYYERRDEFISIDKLNEITGDSSARQAMAELRNEASLAGLIESVKEAKGRDKDVPKDAQGYRLTALPQSRKSRESR